MYSPKYDYYSVGSLEEAIALLVRYGEDAKLLAGGQSLIPLMKLRLASPAVLVDLGTVPSLAYIQPEEGSLCIGAMTSETAVERSSLIVRSFPIISDTSSVIADPLIRNIATIGGNIAHGDPANDHPATMVAARALFALMGPNGVREVSADEFFVDMFTTEIKSDEILTQIKIPNPLPGEGCSYVKHERQVGDYAIAGAAVYIEINNSRISRSRIVLTNLGVTPVRCEEAEHVLDGETWSPELQAEAAMKVASAITPWSDERGSAQYRQKIAAYVTERAIDKAAIRAMASYG